MMKFKNFNSMVLNMHLGGICIKEKETRKAFYDNFIIMPLTNDHCHQGVQQSKSHTVYRIQHFFKDKV